MDMDVDDFALDPRYAVFFSLLAQEPGIGRRVQVVGVAQRLVLQHGKLAGFCGHELGRIVAVVFGKTERLRFEPERLEAGCPAALAGKAEGMNVVVADSPPVLELDGQLEGALDLREKVGLVDLQQAVHRAERRNRRLADTDRANGVGLHKHHVEVGADQLGHGGRCSPARGASAHDDDILYFS